MEKPLSITTHHFDLPAPVEAVIRERAGRLEHYFPSLVGCSVRVEGPGRHHRKGGLFNVQIDLRVPGGEPLIVSRQEGKDLRVAVRGAFEAAARQLEDFARVQRGDTKSHELPHAGRVARLFANEGEEVGAAGAGGGTLAEKEGEPCMHHQSSRSERSRSSSAQILSRAR